jgi:prefoldin beta subunit
LATLRNQRATQQNENEMVHKELEISKTDAEIFKLIGPALVKQSRDEAISDVKKRIDFIKAEMYFFFFFFYNY